MPAWHGRTSLWGKELPVQPNGVTTPLRFPGQYADAETGLNYNVHRYYDPAIGRYLSQDPLGLAPAPNPVAYVDNPHSATDPLGLAKGGTIDFDWPGGDKKGEEYNKWMGVRDEINHMGRYPGDTPPGKVDELIDKYHELDRPSGRHETIEEFRDRPGKPDGNPKWPAGPDATKWPGQQGWKWPGEDGWKPGK